MGIHYDYKSTKSAKLMEKQAKRERKLAEKMIRLSGLQVKDNENPKGDIEIVSVILVFEENFSRVVMRVYLERNNSEGVITIWPHYRHVVGGHHSWTGNIAACTDA